MKNILVSIDLEKDSGILIKKATELALKFNSKVWILHVAAPDPDFVGYTVGPQYIRDIRAGELRKEHKMIGRYSDGLKKKGIKAEGLLIAGATVEMILHEIEKLKITLLVIGHHQHSLLYKIFAGNNTDLEIAKRSKIPVLIVPL